MKNKDQQLKITDPEQTAAGLEAVKVATRNVLGKMGVVRGTRAMLKINQAGGIDCQSCAWPDPESHRTFAEFCENGAKAMADEGTTKRIGADFFKSHSVDELTRQPDYWLNDQGRLTEPLVLKEGGTHYEPIPWEVAFELISLKLNSLASPDEAIFYTSGRTSNEAAFLYQLFVRQFGTNNLPDCSNMCHESTSVALGESIGLGKATIRMSDFEKTDLVIVIGQNPGTNAPRMLTSLAAAKANGAKMIAINPLPEAGLMNFKDPNPQHGNPFSLIAGKGVKLADLHLSVRIGGDMAVLKGVMKVLLDRERSSPGTVFDHDFIAAKTDGYEDVIASIDETSWDDIVASSGLERDQIEQAAEMIIASNGFITCWAMGVTQHTDAVATIQDIVNLHLLRGSIGRPGAGLCPVRGHSNVQGDRTMGIWEKMNPVFRENLEREFGFKTPEHDGFNTVESIAAMLDGRAKVFFAMGGNFAAASPDTATVEKALRNCDLTVQVITKLNRTALVPGKVSLILPCLGRSEIDRSADTLVRMSVASTRTSARQSHTLTGAADLARGTGDAGRSADTPVRMSVASTRKSLGNSQSSTNADNFAGGTGDADKSVRTPFKGVRAPREQFVSTESTMLNVQMSKGIFPPASEHLRSEPWIVCQLAKATLGGRTTVDWDAMAADYDNIRDAISRVVPGCENYNERIRTKAGFYMPNPPNRGEFLTQSGKALLKASKLEPIDLPPGRLLMTTIRSHDQFNTTVYDLDDRYRGIRGSRRVILMNEKNIIDLGLEAGQAVDITSHWEDGERHVTEFIAVRYPIPVDCCATYFPEANPLVPLGSAAKRSGTPTSKCVIVSVRPSEK